MSDARVLHNTYEMSPHPPAAMGWDEYASKATTRWHNLINSDQCQEREIRDFLVEHPAFVPGASGVTNPSGDEPCHQALLAESPLREWVLAEDRYRTVECVKVPDFIWLARNSEGVTPVLIAIRRPSEKWFTRNGQPEKNFLQAIADMAAWRDWLSQPRNVVAFHSNFGTPVRVRRPGGLRPEFVLIYGRHVEFEGRADLDKLRSQFQGKDQAVMTFDDLKPVRECAGCISACINAERERVLSVPPTIQLGPGIAGAWCGMRGFPEAIRRSEWISPERKQFLIERLPYWQQWATSPKRIPYRVNWDDWE